MANGNIDEVSDTLRTLATDWLGEQVCRYLDRLQDNFFRRAANTSDPGQHSQLMDQHLRIQHGTREALDVFTRFLLMNLGSSRPYESGAYAPLDQLLLSWQRHPEYQDNSSVHILLRAISPMSVMAGFQQIEQALNLAPEHRHQALTLFNVLIIRDLNQLYDSLKAVLVTPTANQLDRWIDHTREQLSKPNLSSHQRALGEMRLDRLQGRAKGLATTARTSSLSDEQLIESVAGIFYSSPGSNRQNLPAPVLASLNTLQTLSCSIALKERESFLSPLHPVRRICHQIVATCTRLEQADPDSRRQFEQDLRDLARRLSEKGAGKDTLVRTVIGNFTRNQDAIDNCCQQLIDNARLYDRRKLRDEAGKERVAKLRREVHKLIDNKTRNSHLPTVVDNLLYGPLSTILVYHWLRHGGNSSHIQRNLKLVDDILNYIRPHADWGQLRRAKAMAGTIETELMDGLRRINYNERAAKALLSELHQLRLIASGSAEISKGEY